MKTQREYPKKTVDEYGNEKWTDSFLRLHRLDGPAYISALGTYAWYFKGLRHRVGGPAIITPDDHSWWNMGKFYASKEDYWDSLSDNQKTACLLSEDFFKY
jgi:hypothetical protein